MSIGSSRPVFATFIRVLLLVALQTPVQSRAICYSGDWIANAYSTESANSNDENIRIIRDGDKWRALGALRESMAACCPGYEKVESESSDDKLTCRLSCRADERTSRPECASKLVKIEPDDCWMCEDGYRLAPVRDKCAQRCDADGHADCVRVRDESHSVAICRNELPSYDRVDVCDARDSSRERVSCVPECEADYYPLHELDECADMCSRTYRQSAESELCASTCRGECLPETDLKMTRDDARSEKAQTVSDWPSKREANRALPACVAVCKYGYQLRADGVVSCASADGASFALLDESAGACSPVCQAGCDNGYCSAPDRCTCYDGYVNDPLAGCVAYCSEPCANNSVCVSPNRCDCAEGYALEEERCVAQCAEPCSNGYCLTPDQCECDLGYYFSEGVCLAVEAFSDEERYATTLLAPSDPAYSYHSTRQNIYDAYPYEDDSNATRSDKDFSQTTTAKRSDDNVNDSQFGGNSSLVRDIIRDILATASVDRTSTHPPSTKGSKWNNAKSVSVPYVKNGRGDFVTRDDFAIDSLIDVFEDDGKWSSEKRNDFLRKIKIAYRFNRMLIWCNVTVEGFSENDITSTGNDSFSVTLAPDRSDLFEKCERKLCEYLPVEVTEDGFLQSSFSLSKDPTKRGNLLCYAIDWMDRIEHYRLLFLGMGNESANARTDVNRSGVSKMEKQYDRCRPTLISWGPNASVYAMSTFFKYSTERTTSDVLSANCVWYPCHNKTDLTMGDGRVTRTNLCFLNADARQSEFASNIGENATRNAFPAGTVICTFSLMALLVCMLLTVAAWTCYSRFGQVSYDVRNAEMNGSIGNDLGDVARNSCGDASERATELKEIRALPPTIAQPTE